MGNSLSGGQWHTKSRSRKQFKDLDAGGVATFGAGCYWGTEKFYAKDFAKAHPGEDEGCVGACEFFCMISTTSQ